MAKPSLPQAVRKDKIVSIRFNAAETAHLTAKYGVPAKGIRALVREDMAKKEAAR